MLIRPNKKTIREIKHALCLGYNTNKPIREHVGVADTTVYEYLQYLIANDSDVKYYIPEGKSRGIYVIRVQFLSNYYQITVSSNKAIIDSYVEKCTQVQIDQYIYYVPGSEQKLIQYKTINKTPKILDDEPKKVVKQERQCGFCGDLTDQDTLCKNCQIHASQKILQINAQPLSDMADYEFIAIGRLATENVLKTVKKDSKEMSYYVKAKIQNGFGHRDFNTLPEEIVNAMEGLEKLRKHHHFAIDSDWTK